MLYGFLKENVGENLAPFVCVALFLLIVGASLWLTPRLARWIEGRRRGKPGFYDDMMTQSPEDEEK